MPPRSPSLSLSLLGLALLVWSPPAVACECGAAGWILPDASVKDVPSNTKVWVSGSGVSKCDNPSLEKESGETIALSRSAVSRSGTRFDEIVILAPQGGDLEVGATYTVKGCELFSFGVPPGPVSFKVTSGPDQTAPVVPKFSPQEPVTGSEDSCGKPAYWKAMLEGDGTFHLLDIAGRAGYDPATRTGAALDVFLNRSGALSTSTVSVGQVPCGTNWSFDDSGEASALRLSSLDLAGNFSGWSAPQTLASPEEDGCGCATPGRRRATAPWLLGVALAVSLVGRRRRV